MDGAERSEVPTVAKLFYRWADLIEPLPTPVWALVVLVTSIVPVILTGAALAAAVVTLIGA